MKTRILSIILVSLISMNFAFAGGEIETVSKADVKQAVKIEIGYPDFAIEDRIEGNVLVSFTVGDNGKIILNQINSPDIELKNYVAEKLQRMQLEETKQYNENDIYTIKFSFILM